MTPIDALAARLRHDLSTMGCMPGAGGLHRRLNSHLGRVAQKIASETSTNEPAPEQRLLASLLSRVDQEIDAALHDARVTYHRLRHLDVEYVRGVSNIRFRYDGEDLFLGVDPALGLDAIVAIRSSPVDVQHHLADYAWLRSVEERLLRESADERLRDGFDLGEAQSHVADSASRVSKRGARLIRAAESSLQWHLRSVIVPMLSERATPDRIAFAAARLDDLLNELDIFRFDAIVGRQRVKAHSCFEQISSCTEQLRVAGSWLWALAAMQEHLPCELCYRHRATRQRCRMHKSSGTQGRDARAAAHLHFAFLFRFYELQDELGKCRLLASPRPVPTDPKAAARSLRRSVRKLLPLLGDDLAAAARRLCAQMISKVFGILRGGAGGAQRARLIGFLSLEGFWSAWCRKRPSERWGALPIDGKAMDPDNPAALAGLLPETLTAELLSQRAWHETERDSTRVSTISYADIQEAMRLHPDAKSLRRIAQLLGCSHTYVARVLRGGGTQESLARARAYFGVFRTDTLP